jgi:2-dehydropantoate 2-reductase
MRVVVVGVGAVGGWIAAGLARGGAEVALLARGPTLAALRAEGLVLRHGAAEERFRLPTSDQPAALPPPDLLVLGLKGQDLPAALPTLRPLLGSETRILSVQNGVPWWFPHGGGTALESVDPGGALAAALPAARSLAAVVHAGSITEAPGVVRLMTANRLPVGAVAGDATWRDAVVATLLAGGLPAEASDDIAGEVWRKLWGNMNMNPLSALSRATLSDMLDDEGVRGLAEAMMREMDAIGPHLGLAPLGDPAARMAVSRRLGAFRTSMLQDLEAGRRLELGPILGALVELAARFGQKAPVMRGVHGLVRLLVRG